MRAMVIATLAAAALFGSVSGAAAQRDASDRAERGQRLDSLELRNDLSQQRLKKPVYPQWGQPATAPVPEARPARSKKKPQ
jgi:hypothetical protein